MWNNARVPYIGFEYLYDMGYFCIQFIKGGDCVAVKKATTKKKVTRKDAYKRWLTPEGLVLLEGWARDGLTDEQIANNMGIHPSTYYKWKAKHIEIDEAVKKGKEVVDYIIENALLKSAMGYQYDEVTQVRIDDEDTGESKMTEVKRVTKDVAPNPTALIFYLKNRQPHKWRDKKQLEANVEVSNPFDGISTEDIKKLLGE